MKSERSIDAPATYLVARGIVCALGAMLLLSLFMTNIDNPQFSAFDDPLMAAFIVLSGLALCVPYFMAENRWMFWFRMVLFLAPASGAIHFMLLLFTGLNWERSFSNIIAATLSIVTFAMTIGILLVVVCLPPCTLWWRRQLTTTGSWFWFASALQNSSC